MAPTRILAASTAFFALIFGAGVALGAVRVLLFQPYFGANASRLLELPVMVVISYLAAQFITRNLGPATRNPWLKVGFIAFLLLMAAEFALGVFVFRTPLRLVMADMVTPIGFLSFLAQALIIIFPALAAGWDRTRL